MGEHKANPAAQTKDAEKKAPTYEELIAMPIAEADARKRLAEIDIQIAQCQKERAVIDQRIADIAWVRQVILRQVLNGEPAKTEPAPEAK